MLFYPALPHTTPYNPDQLHNPLNPTLTFWQQIKLCIIFQSLSRLSDCSVWLHEDIKRISILQEKTLLLNLMRLNFPLAFLKAIHCLLIAYRLIAISPLSNTFFPFTNSYKNARRMLLIYNPS